MEILIMIYFAINIFISGSILVYCMQDEDSWFKTLTIILLYALFGCMIALVITTGYLIDYYFNNKR